MTLQLTPVNRKIIYVNIRGDHCYVCQSDSNLEYKKLEEDKKFKGHYVKCNNCGSVTLYNENEDYIILEVYKGEKLIPLDYED